MRHSESRPDEGPEPCSADEKTQASSVQERLRALEHPPILQIDEASFPEKYRAVLERLQQALKREDILEAMVGEGEARAALRHLKPSP